ncbi:MAG: DUF2892 domain-containing protein [Verrucomicrobiota bacterium]
MLTTQPFAHIPELEKLGQELYVNVSDSERSVSTILGAVAAATALAYRGPARWLLLLTGAAFIRRGVVGHCPLYDHLKINQHSVKEPAPSWE